jgi:hypothetical protein
MVLPAQISELVCYHSLATGVSGSSSAVERQLPKLDVAGSIPVSRSIHYTIDIPQLTAELAATDLRPLAAPPWNYCVF